MDQGLVLNHGFGPLVSRLSELLEFLVILCRLFNLFLLLFLTRLLSRRPRRVSVGFLLLEALPPLERARPKGGEGGIQNQQGIVMLDASSEGGRTLTPNAVPMQEQGPQRHVRLHQQL